MMAHDRIDCTDFGGWSGFHMPTSQSSDLYKSKRNNIIASKKNVKRFNKIFSICSLLRKSLTGGTVTLCYCQNNLIRSHPLTSTPDLAFSDKKRYCFITFRIRPCLFGHSFVDLSST